MASGAVPRRVSGEMEDGSRQGGKGFRSAPVESEMPLGMPGAPGRALCFLPTWLPPWVGSTFALIRHAVFSLGHCLDLGAERQVLLQEETRVGASLPACPRRGVT